RHFLSAVHIALLEAPGKGRGDQYELTFGIALEDGGRLVAAARDRQGQQQPSGAPDLRGQVRHAYSAWIFAALMTSAHFGISARMRSRNCSGVPPPTSLAVARMASRCSGICRIAFRSRLSRSTIERGVPAGMTTPCQL